MIGATAAPLADGLNPMGDYEKMDKSLRDSLSSSSEDDIIPVIFQLNSEVTSDDLEKLAIWINDSGIRWEIDGESKNNNW